MEPEPFAAAWICLAVMRLGTRMAARFDEEFRKHGITQAQFRLLMAVHTEGGADGIAPSVLADHLLIERASVSVLASRLVDQGLLERRPGENRRTHRLVLTESGRHQFLQAAPRALALAHETLSGMTPEELHHMRLMLERLEAHIRVATGQLTAQTSREENAERQRG